MNNLPLPWNCDHGYVCVYDTEQRAVFRAASCEDAKAACDAGNALLTPKLVSECGLPKNPGTYVTWFYDGLTSRLQSAPTDASSLVTEGMVAWFKLPELPKPDLREQAWKEKEKTLHNCSSAIAKECFYAGYDEGKKEAK